MTLKDLLETVLLDQRITLIHLIDCGICEDQLLLDRVEHSKIPYSTIAEFLDSIIVTIEAQIDETGQPFLYVEVL